MSADVACAKFLFQSLDCEMRLFLAVKLGLKCSCEKAYIHFWPILYGYC